MSIYSVDKLISQARKLGADYKKSTGKVLPGLSNEIAEYDASRLLDLELCQDKTEGYDALGRGSRKGKRIQIKGRTIFDETKTGQRIGQIKAEKEWDSVVLILLDSEYQPYEIFEVQREKILDVLGKSSASKKNRGALSVARFRNIGQRVWTRENGLETQTVNWQL